MTDKPAISGLPYSAYLTGGGDSTGKAFIEIDKAGNITNRLVVGWPGIEMHLQDEVTAIFKSSEEIPSKPPISNTTGKPMEGFKFTKFSGQVVVNVDVYRVEELPDPPQQGLQVLFNDAVRRWQNGSFNAFQEMIALQNQAAALKPPVILTITPK